MWQARWRQYVRRKLLNSEDEAIMNAADLISNRDPHVCTDEDANEHAKTHHEDHNNRCAACIKGASIHKTERGI